MIVARRANTAALPAAIAAIDACWIFAAGWLFEGALLGSIKPFAVPHPALLALLELAGWWAMDRALSGKRVSARRAQPAAAVVGLPASLGLLLALNFPQGDFSAWWLLRAGFALFVCLAVWLLGGFRSTQRVDFNTAYRAFGTGLVVISASVLLANIVLGTRGPDVWAALGTLPIWFFTVSLLAMALGNRELIRREVGALGGPMWGAVLLVSVAGVLLLGILSGAFSLGGLLEVAGNIVSFVLLTVGYIIYLILLPIFRFLSLILPQVEAGPAKGPRGATSTFDPLGELRRQFEKGTPQQMPAELQNFFFGAAIVVTAVVVIVGLLVAARLFSRTRATRVKSLPEDRESFGSWELLKQQALAWLQALLARFRRGKGAEAAPADELAALRGNPEWAGTLSVRQIYARLQTLAAEKGHPRAPQQTPIEYLAVLSGAMPRLRPELAAITSAYLEARYGPLPASASAVLAATNAWKRVEGSVGSPE